jgi:hypothetical protein
MHDQSGNIKAPPNMASLHPAGTPEGAVEVSGSDRESLPVLLIFLYLLHSVVDFYTAYRLRKAQKSDKQLREATGIGPDVTKSSIIESEAEKEKKAESV